MKLHVLTRVNHLLLLKLYLISLLTHSVSWQQNYAKYTYLFLRNIIFQVICTLFTCFVYTLHWNKRMFVCSGCL